MSSPSKMESYIEGRSSIIECKDDVLKRMTMIKKKIDTIEDGQKQDQQIQTTLFINKFKKDLKFILNQFQEFHKVLDKVNKELYQKHELSKQLIVNTIRQQMKRFHHLIPKHIQQDVQASKIKGSIIRSKISVQSNDSDTQHVKKQQIVEAKNNQNQLKPQQQQEEQFEQLISNLNGFLVQSMIEEDKQNEAKQCQQTQIQTLESLLLKKESSKEQQQQLEERKRYRIYIQNESKRQARKPYKIAGGILCGLLLLILIIVSLIIYAIYRIFNSVMQDL